MFAGNQRVWRNISNAVVGLMNGVIHVINARVDVRHRNSLYRLACGVRHLSEMWYTTMFTLVSRVITLEAEGAFPTPASDRVLTWTNSSRPASNIGSRDH